MTIMIQGRYDYDDDDHWDLSSICYSLGFTIYESMMIAIFTLWDLWLPLPSGNLTKLSGDVPYSIASG